MIETLIIIPIISTAFVFFISGIIPYVLGNDINTIYIVISTLVLLISSFLLPNSLNKTLKNIKFINNLNNHSNLCSSYVSFLLLFIFAIALLINAIFIKFSIFKFFIGIAITILFIYINYLLFAFKECVLECIDIEEENSLNCITFIDEEEKIIEYYTKEKVKENTHYKVVMNKHTRWVKKIVSEVIVLEG